MTKRTFDIVAAAFLLVVLGPLMLAIALWVRLTTPGPIFFRQSRVGLNGGQFRIFKFRTMIDGVPKSGHQVTAANDDRITDCGRVLRKYKLDELPQLLNVLCGDMSLVGPRPEVPSYVMHWSDCDRKIILSVRPGITDPASIKFRDEEVLLASADDRERFYIETILPEKLAIYRDYVVMRSFLGDLAILGQTVVHVFLRDRAGHAAMTSAPQ